MASFRGIKERINSVKTTRKITSAMRMVSSAKLIKAQKQIAGMFPYSEAMHRILDSLITADGHINIPLARKGEVNKVAIIVFSSDSSYAGAFNSNIAKEMIYVIESYSDLPRKNVQLYTIGKKVYEAAVKQGYEVERDFEGLASAPDYGIIFEFAGELIKQFTEGELDKVELIYHHFRSAGSQVITKEDFLPLRLPEKPAEYGPEFATKYIFEPSREHLLETLLPKTLKLELYKVLLDSNVSEHAARMIAMQTATDNADDLVDELTIEYNKSRQQAITNELLDIVGGSMN